MNSEILTLATVGVIIPIFLAIMVIDMHKGKRLGVFLTSLLAGLKAFVTSPLAINLAQQAIVLTFRGISKYSEDLSPEEKQSLAAAAAKRVIENSPQFIRVLVNEKQVIFVMQWLYLKIKDRIKGFEMHPSEIEAIVLEVNPDGKG